MNTVIQTPPTPPLVGVGRNVIFRTRGYAHGPVVRMVSASDVGKMIKPFVFLDLVDTQEPIGQQGFGWHPHSGIATLTLAMEGQGRYVESIGHSFRVRRPAATSCWTCCRAWC
jgi:redox-sensitive bicupin YhaK (pirin superfamily)